MRLEKFYRMLETHVLCVEINGVIRPAADFNYRVKHAFFITEKGRIYVS